MNRFTSFLALVCLCCTALIPPLFAAPEELSPIQIRQDLMRNAGPVNAFLDKAKETINKQMKEAIEAGRISRTDPESIKLEMGKHAESILAKAATLRATLKEPEYRLKLDMELLQLAVGAGKVKYAMNILSNWKGEIKHIMVLTAGQVFQQTKTDFPKELETLLATVAKSENSKFATVAKQLLDPFRRNPIGAVFPDFPTGKTTTDGKELSLKRFKGKILLVDFWATWCPPCRVEVPNLVKTYNKFKDKGFAIVGISFDKERSELYSYIEENKMSWPQYFDGKGWQNEVGSTYGIRSIPTMYLLDKDGRVITKDLRNGKLEIELEKRLK